MTAEEAFDQVVRTLTRQKNVTTARAFGALGLRVGEKFFAMVYKGNMVVKLPEARVAELLAARHGQRFDPGHGRKMKEWVAIGLGRQRDRLAMAREARTFGASASARAAKGHRTR